MSTLSAGPEQPQLDDRATTPSAQEKSESQSSNGIPPEMQRQMEAARERMRKYHAVYKPPPEKPGS
jgi:hypothetical protein